MRTKEEVDKMVEENIGLVNFIMNKYYKNSVYIHNDLRDDIYQEASIGLFKAAQTYDETKGIRFSTYASKAIRNLISRFFDRYIYKHYNAGVISLECSLYEKYDEESEQTISDSLEVEEGGYAEILIQDALEESKYHIKGIERIAKLRLDGYYQREIAKEFNVTQVEISRRLKLLENRFEKAC